MNIVPDAGELEQTPCAEAFLSERAVGRLVEQGLAVLNSVRGSDAARIGPVRSLDGAFLELGPGA